MGETSAGGPERIRISVVVPARNAVNVLGAQLDALAAQEVPVPWEVVVADNGSTDGTRELAASWHDRLPVRVVDASAHAGVNHARNRGVHTARGDLVLCCDADDVVQPGWVAAYWHTRDEWDMAGGFIGVDALNGPEALARHADVKYGGLNQFGWLKTFMGCNFAFHRRVFTAISGFDEGFSGGCDDVDFAFRGQLAGFRLGYVPEAAVAYRLRETLRDTVRQHYRYGITRVHLFRKFRPVGMPRRSWKHTARAYALTMARIPDLLTRGGRGRWVVDAAFLVGLASGSLHDHTLYLSE